MTNDERFQRLLRAGHACILIQTLEERDSLDVVRNAAVQFNRPLWIWSAAGGVFEGLLAENPPAPGTEDPNHAFSWLAARDRSPICVMLDLCGHLRSERTLGAYRNLLAHFERSGSQLVLVDHAAEIPEVVRSYAASFELSLPDEVELEALIRATLRRRNDDRPIEIDITRRGLQTIIRNLRGLTRRQARRIIEDVVEDRRFDDADINRVLAAKRRALSQDGLLEYIETPVDLGEIGGLRRLKHWLAARRESVSPAARDFGLAAPRGVLMLGVQGAGKSLCAKAIATAWQRPLMRMDVGALYDKYVGQTERQLRDALRQAESMAPVILWIDEIEKAFASAASRSTDGGLSMRLFGSLLTWMQEHAAPVFIVATANDIEALPPELLRKGRFDEIFFVDLPDEPTRREILAIHLKKRARDPAKFDLDALARESDGFSGAELEQAVIAALHDAYAQHRDIDTDAVRQAIAASPPLSVTMAERVAALREWADGRCVPAD